MFIQPVLQTQNYSSGWNTYVLFILWKQFFTLIGWIFFSFSFTRTFVEIEKNNNCNCLGLEFGRLWASISWQPGAVLARRSPISRLMRCASWRWSFWNAENCPTSAFRANSCALLRLAILVYSSANIKHFAVNNAKESKSENSWAGGRLLCEHCGSTRAPNQIRMEESFPGELFPWEMLKNTNLNIFQVWTSAASDPSHEIAEHAFGIVTNVVTRTFDEGFYFLIVAVYFWLNIWQIMHKIHTGI